MFRILIKKNFDFILMLYTTINDFNKDEDELLTFTKYF